MTTWADLKGSKSVYLGCCQKTHSNIHSFVRSFILFASNVLLASVDSKLSHFLPALGKVSSYSKKKEKDLIGKKNKQPLFLKKEKKSHNI